jgi:hypothetical protein
VSAIDEAAAASALNRYQNLNSSITNLSNSIAQQQRNLFERHRIVVGADGRAATNSLTWTVRQNSAVNSYNASVAQLEALQRQQPALRQQLVEWEQLLGRIKPAPIDVTATPARTSVLDSIRSILGTKKRLTKAVPYSTESEQAAGAVARQSAGVSADAANALNTTHTQIHGPDPKPNKPVLPEVKDPPEPEPPKTGLGSITFKMHAGRTTTIRKYDPDQRRDDHGRFTDEGKGGGGGGGGIGRAAAITAGALTAYALAHPAGRALARHLRHGNLVARRDALREARRREAGQRLTQPSAMDRLNRQYESRYPRSSRMQVAGPASHRDRKGSHTELDVAAFDIKLRLLDLLGRWF